MTKRHIRAHCGGGGYGKTDIGSKTSYNIALVRIFNQIDHFKPLNSPGIESKDIENEGTLFSEVYLVDGIFRKLNSSISKRII